MSRAHLAPLVALLLLFFGCRLPTTNTAAPIVYREESLTLEWDAPTVDFSGTLAIAGYQVYYRLHGQQAWTLLKEVPARSGSQLLIHHSQLGDGLFDFAVNAVNALGQPSGKHSSLDTDAEPFGGWYVLWIYQ
jgi:hypothetical protein